MGWGGGGGTTKGQLQSRLVNASVVVLLSRGDSISVCSEGVPQLVGSQGVAGKNKFGHSDLHGKKSMALRKELSARNPGGNQTEVPPRLGAWIAGFRVQSAGHYTTGPNPLVVTLKALLTCLSFLKSSGLKSGSILLSVL